jgi:hypothetical protein
MTANLQTGLWPTSHNKCILAMGAAHVKQQQQQQPSARGVRMRECTAASPTCQQSWSKRSGPRMRQPTAPSSWVSELRKSAPRRLCPCPHALGARTPPSIGASGSAPRSRTSSSSTCGPPMPPASQTLWPRGVDQQVRPQKGGSPPPCVNAKGCCCSTCGPPTAQNSELGPLHTRNGSNQKGVPTQLPPNCCHCQKGPYWPRCVAQYTRTLPGIQAYSICACKGVLLFPQHPVRDIAALTTCAGAYNCSCFLSQMSAPAVRATE